eukprot:1486550-Rhodomonas_salina.1
MCARRGRGCGERGGIQGRGGVQRGRQGAGGGSAERGVIGGGGQGGLHPTHTDTLGGAGSGVRGRPVRCSARRTLRTLSPRATAVWEGKVSDQLQGVRSRLEPHT